MHIMCMLLGSEGTVSSACETSGATRPAMQLHQGELNPQQHDCENIRLKISICSFNVTLRISTLFEALVVTADVYFIKSCQAIS